MHYRKISVHFPGRESKEAVLQWTFMGIYCLNRFFSLCFKDNCSWTLNLI
jgi:hypothetical protein